MGGTPSFPIISIPRERIFIITGGNTGIGYEAAKHIAMMGATVIIACRSQQRAEDAIKRMNEDYAKAKASGKLHEHHIYEDKLPVEFMRIDLSSLKSVMDFIQAFKSSGRKLHTLMCNAGLALTGKEITEDGFEKHFQVNYLSHFLLISHLLPVMKDSGEDCRVVLTSSLGHKFCSFESDKFKQQFTDPRDYGNITYYSKSKLFQLMHMSSLTRRLRNSNVTVTSLHPGVVDTDLARHYTENCCLSCLISCGGSMRMTRSPYQGAVTLINLAVNPKLLGVSNVYHVDCAEAVMASDARNEKYQEELWTFSLDALKNYLPNAIVSELNQSAS